MVRRSAIFGLGLSVTLAACGAADGPREGTEAVIAEDASGTEPVAEAAAEPPAPDSPTGPDEGALEADAAAAAAAELPAEGTPYNAARRALLAQGYGPSIGECNGIGIATCDAFPELDNCSGTGAGYCDGTFQRDGRCIAVVTSGGPPEEGNPNVTVASAELVGGGCDRGPLFP